jgi:4-aminobutyrate aminotransferase-like enzyme
MEPPLLVSEAEIDEGIAILAGALDEVAGEQSV